MNNDRKIHLYIPYNDVLDVVNAEIRCVVRRLTQCGESMR